MGSDLSAGVTETGIRMKAYTLPEVENIIQLSRIFLKALRQGWQWQQRDGIEPQEGQMHLIPQPLSTGGVEQCGSQRRRYLRLHQSERSTKRHITLGNPLRNGRLTKSA